MEEAKIEMMLMELGPTHVPIRQRKSLPRDTLSTMEADTIEESEEELEDTESDVEEETIEGPSSFSLISLGWVIMLIGMMLGIGALVFGSFQSSGVIASDSNVSTTSLSIASIQYAFQGWVPIIIILVVIGIIFGLIRV